MTKDEAEAIHALARQLLEDDVSCETRCRIARKIITHARAIKASCMAEPVTIHGAEREARNVTWCEPTITVNIDAPDLASWKQAVAKHAAAWMSAAAEMPPMTTELQDAMDRLTYGTPIPFEWSANRQTTHVPANYG